MHGFPLCRHAHDRRFGNHLPTLSFNKLNQSIRQLGGGTLKTVVSINIQSVDEGKDVGGDATSQTTTQTTHIAQQVPQFRIVDIGGDELIRWLVKLLAELHILLTSGPQKKESHFICDGIHGRHIALDVILFFGKLLLEIGSESLSPARDTIRPPVLMAIDLVHAVCIDRTNPDLVVKTEIAEDPVKGTAGLKTTQHVHTRVEGDTIATERLQAASRTRATFQNSHLVTLLA